MGLRTLVSFARDPLGLFEGLATRGDIVPLRLGPHPAVFLDHPELIRRVAVAERRSLARGYSAAVLRTVLGSGLLVSEGAHWERQRRTVQPALRETLPGLRCAIGGALDRMLRSWPTGEVRDAHEEMRRLTLDVAARAILGITPEGSAGPLDEGLEAMVAGTTFSLFSLVPGLRRLPTPAQRRARRGQRALDATVARGRGGLVAHLRERMDERSLRDELVTLLFTAFDTTAAALCWTLYLLARAPRLRDRLAADPVLVDDVIRESLRLYPPVPIQARDVISTFVLAGTTIPAGTTVLWSQWVVHRDPRWFDRPNAFEPERWRDGLAERLPPFAYFPFGGGRRNCVGEDVGTSMLREILTCLASRAHLEPAGDRPVKPYALVTLRPRGGMPMRLVPLSPSA